MFWDISAHLSNFISTSVDGIAYSAHMTRNQIKPREVQKDFLKDFVLQNSKFYADFKDHQEKLEKTGETLSFEWHQANIFELAVRVYYSGGVIKANGSFVGSNNLSESVLLLALTDTTTLFTEDVKISTIQEKIKRLNVNMCTVKHNHSHKCEDMSKLCRAARDSFEKNYGKELPKDISKVIIAVECIKDAKLQAIVVCKSLMT